MQHVRINLLAAIPDKATEKGIDALLADTIASIGGNILESKEFEYIEQIPDPNEQVNNPSPKENGSPCGILMKDIPSKIIIGIENEPGLKIALKALRKEFPTASDEDIIKCTMMYTASRISPAAKILLNKSDTEKTGN